MNIQAVIEKVQKLLALADRGRSKTTEAEAMRAAEAAARLMRQHQLEEAQVIGRGEEAEEEVSCHMVEEGGGRTVGWRCIVFEGVCRMMRCYAYRRRSSFWMIGRKSDREAVAYLTGYIARQVAQAAETESRAYGIPASEARTWRHTFRVACAARVRERLTELAMENDAKLRLDAGLSGALVVFQARDQAIARIKAEMRFSSVGKVTARANSGDAAGRAAGDRINLSAGGKHAL